MKVLIKFLFVVACIALIAGCEKPDEFYPEEDFAELKGAKIKVQPSNETNVLDKAHEDWARINEALQNAKPGQTVQLAAGTFYLHKSIVCWNFNGTLKGAGEGKTIIRTAPGEIFNIEDCPPINWSFGLSNGAFMLCFAHDYFEDERTVSVSDLSIIVDEPTPVFLKNITSGREMNSIHAIMVMYTGFDNDRENPVDLNVSYKNLSVKGEYDEKYLYEDYSLFSALSGYGYSNGTFEVKNVSVENASGCIKPHAFMGDDARIIIKNNQLISCVRGVYSFFGHSWVIQNNEIKDNKKNGIVMLKRGPSRQIWDGPEGNSFIANNVVYFTGQLALGVQYVSNVQVRNNVFVGSGLFGAIGCLNGDNWIIKDNDLCGVAPTPKFNCTIYFNNLTNSEIKNNANQIIGGPGALEPTNIIGEGRECDE